MFPTHVHLEDARRVVSVFYDFLFFYTLVFSRRKKASELQVFATRLAHFVTHDITCFAVIKSKDFHISRSI